MINPYLETIITLCLVNVIFALSLNLIVGYNGQFSLGHAGFLAVGAYTSVILVRDFHLPFAIGLLGGAVLAALVGLLIGLPVLRLRGDYLAIATLGFAEILRNVLFVLPDQHFGGAIGLREYPRLHAFFPLDNLRASDPRAGINASLNLAFTFVFAVLTLVIALAAAIWIGRWLGGAAEKLLAKRMLLSPRIAAYVVWAALLMFVVVRFFANFRGFSTGMFEFNLAFAKDARETNQWEVFVFLVLIVAFVTWLIRNYLNSTYGRAVVAIREDEVAATNVGLNIYKFKTLNFVVGTFFAGAAGSLLAHSIPAFNPNEFDFFKSVDVLLMVVLGGLGSISGTFLGATALTILPEALREFKAWRLVIYALALVLLMVFRPGGILGYHEFSLPKLRPRRRRATS
jgi:branched-chain amino acid transport system permease protein